MTDNNMTLLYILISIVVIGADIITSCHAFVERKNHSNVLGVTCIGAALVQFTYLLSVLSQNYFYASLLSSLYFICVDLSVLTLVTFVRVNSINRISKFNKFIKYFITIYFVIDSIILLINPFYEIAMHYEDVGGIIARFAYKQMPLYWLHLLFNYIMLVIVFYHLIKRVLIVPREYNKPYVFTIFSLLLVIGINGVFLFVPKLFGNIVLDYSIWGYSIAAFSIYLNYFRYPEGGMRAYYNQWIVQNVNQGIVLLNYEGKVIIVNDKVKSIFKYCKIQNGMTSEELYKRIGLENRNNRNNEDFSFQYYITQDQRELPIRIDHRIIRNKSQAVVGQLFVFTDEAGDVDLLTSFYNWEKFEQILKEEPWNFEPPVTVAVCDINGLGDINTNFGKNIGDQAISLLANIIREEFKEGTFFVRGHEANLIILSFDLEEEEVRKKLQKIHDKLLGMNDLGCILNIQSAIAVYKTGRQTILEVVEQASKGVRNKKLLDVKSRRSELVMSLVKTLAECDNETEAHVKRTQLMGAELGRRLGLSDMQLSDLALLCILHDIGKIGIPLEILNKPARLSDSEWRMMKTHTEKGYQIATSSQELNHIADMILHHHESWDGSGYPDGLSKESIPLLSRIISVVDSYDAMISERPYKKAMPVKDALKELKRCAGKQFDPRIVSEFVKMMPEIHTVDESDLSLDILKAAQEMADTKTSDSKKVLSVSNVHSVTYSRYLLDGSMNILEVDENFESLTGYSKEDIKNNQIQQIDLIPTEDVAEYVRLVGEKIGNNSLAYFEHRIKRKDGTIIFVFCYGKQYYDSAEKAERAEIIVFNASDTYAMKLMINEEKNKAQNRLAKWEDKYRCDSLTGLLSQEAFKNDIEMHLLNSKNRIMLLMMDVDRFKQYNDTYGHRAGDEFLVILSQALTNTLRKDDLACRMGGDEFAAALFFEDDVTSESMYERAQQICDKINLILTTEKGGTSLSMGVVISGDETARFDTLYEQADKALYDAKAKGKAEMAIYKEN